MAKRMHGEGTIYQDKNGLWRGELTLGYDEKGKRIKKGFSSKDINVLQKKMNDEKYKLDRNVITVTNDYKLYEWLDYWLKTYKLHSVKSKTYDGYETSFNIHIKDSIGNINLNKLKHEDIQRLYNIMNKNGLSTSTIKKVHVPLNQALNKAVLNGLIITNPCNGSVIPRVAEKEVRALSLDEQNKLTEVCDTDNTYNNFFMFALNTGMRCGEIISLTWHDIDFSKKQIHVNKSVSTVKNRDEKALNKTKIIVDTAKTKQSNRYVPLNKTALKILELQKLKVKNHVFVFSSKNSTMLIHRNLSRGFEERLAKADLPDDITLHSLRHTFTTRLLEKGANIKVISDILGHSSIKLTLDTYSHVMPNIKQDTISLLD